MVSPRLTSGTTNAYSAGGSAIPDPGSASADPSSTAARAALLPKKSRNATPTGSRRRRVEGVEVVGMGFAVPETSRDRYRKVGALIKTSGPPGGADGKSSAIPPGAIGVGSFLLAECPSVRQRSRRERVQAHAAPCAHGADEAGRGEFLHVVVHGRGLQARRVRELQVGETGLVAQCLQDLAGARRLEGGRPRVHARAAREVARVASHRAADHDAGAAQLVEVVREGAVGQPRLAAQFVQVDARVRLDEVDQVLAGRMLEELVALDAREQADEAQDLELRPDPVQRAGRDGEEADAGGLLRLWGPRASRYPVDADGRSADPSACARGSRIGDRSEER